MSLRAISRLTRLDLKTVLSLLETAGDRCRKLLDTNLRGLHSERIECDETWTFVQKKNKKIYKGVSPDEQGDQWVFIALDPDTKLIPAFTVKRTMHTTQMFCWDLAKRLANRVQITTDGFHFYREAINECFGVDVDFAQLTKLFGDYGQHEDSADRRYSPPRLAEVISKVRVGNPDPEYISTSLVERSNLSLRMHLRRFTRLTNAHSKKLENLKAALCVYFAWYNYCRKSQSIHMTPAMAAGLTDHIWSIAELLGAA